MRAFLFVLTLSLALLSFTEAAKLKKSRKTLSSAALCSGLGVTLVNVATGNNLNLADDIQYDYNGLARYADVTVKNSQYPGFCVQDNKIQHVDSQLFVVIRGPGYASPPTRGATPTWMTSIVALVSPDNTDSVSAWNIQEVNDAWKFTVTSNGATGALTDFGSGVGITEDTNADSQLWYHKAA